MIEQIRILTNMLNSIKAHASQDEKVYSSKWDAEKRVEEQSEQLSEIMDIARNAIKIINKMQSNDLVELTDFPAGEDEFKDNQLQDYIKTGKWEPRDEDRERLRDISKMEYRLISIKDIKWLIRNNERAWEMK